MSVPGGVGGNSANLEEPTLDDHTWENRKFVVSAIVAAAALVLAGVGIGNYFSAHYEPPAATAGSSAGAVKPP
jgi:hypothetical protein